MTKKRVAYKTFTREFNLEAVRLMETSGRASSEIAMELGIRRNQLYKWRDQLMDYPHFSRHLLSSKNILS